jgi:hypothetical protein
MFLHLAIKNIFLSNGGGNWSVSMPSLPIVHGGATLTATDGSAGSSSAPVAVVNDVAVGDLILCSGQSNMVGLLRPVSPPPSSAAPVRTLTRELLFARE